MQDGNLDTLHLVQDSLSGLLMVIWLACWNEPEYSPSFQNLRNVNARGSIFNSVGQNQYNNYVVNSYFTLNINEVDDPVCVFGIPRYKPDVVTQGQQGHTCGIRGALAGESEDGRIGGAGPTYGC